MLLSVAVVYVPLVFATIRQIDIYEIGGSSPAGSASLIRITLVAVKQFLGGFYRILADYYFMDIGGAGVSRIAGLERLLFAATLLLAFGLPLVVLIYLIKFKPKGGLFLALAYLIPF
jgi:hypothetical protein